MSAVESLGGGVDIWTEQDQRPGAPVLVAIEWGMETWRGPAGDVRMGLRRVDAALDRIPTQRAS